jgi:hypothetical protein
MGWPLNPVDKPQLGHDVLRAGFVDRGMQARK